MPGLARHVCSLSLSLAFLLSLSVPSRWGRRAVLEARERLGAATPLDEPSCTFSMRGRTSADARQPRCTGRRCRRVQDGRGEGLFDGFALVSRQSSKTHEGDGTRPVDGAGHEGIKTGVETPEGRQKSRPDARSGVGRETESEADGMGEWGMGVVKGTMSHERLMRTRSALHS